jgi:16S rRNA (cytosine1407-C5)-methyltransferase
VLRAPDALAKWSPARPRQLARRQYALLCSALDACRTGGRIVYATCSVCPQENDGVIARLSRRRKGRFRVLSADAERGEVTEFGRLVLPDVDACGPIFFAVVEKIG